MGRRDGTQGGSGSSERGLHPEPGDQPKLGPDLSSLGAWHQLRLGGLASSKALLVHSGWAGGRAGGLGAAAHIFPVTSFILLPLIPCLSHWERSRGGSWGQGKGLSLGHLQERPAPLTHLPYLGLWADHAQGRPSQHQSYRERPALRTPDMEPRGHVLHQAEN